MNNPHIIRARNVNDALPTALWWLRASGVPEISRNGPVLVAPGPVLTYYTHPFERVLFNEARDANPYFHLMEALWMLAGHNDVDFVAQFNSRMREYSDDGLTLHGAYGFRWRWNFDFDQLEALIAQLKDDPRSRRAVLEMWDATTDLVTMVPRKDVPCNTHAYVDLRGGALNLCVCCRSNDAWWGAYGANYVHFGVLQEYLAAHLGAPVGTLSQFSWNLHMYPEVVSEQLREQAMLSEEDPYRSREVAPMPLVVNPQRWDEELQWFMNDPNERTCQEPFLRDVARPMINSWRARKDGDTGIDEARSIKASDWRRACVEWLDRAEARKAEKEAA